MANETMTPPGASISDIVVALNAANRNSSLIVQRLTQLVAPGETTSTATSPSATLVTTLSTASVQIIGSSSSRRAIMFFNPNPSGVNMWVVPSNVTAVINGGVPLTPGGSFQVPATLATNSAWKAIASTGSNNTLVILEFF